MIGRLARSVLAHALAPILALAIVLLAWVLFLRVFQVSPLIGKSPVAVAHYLFGAPASPRDRAALLGALCVTLAHAASGFLIGLGLGLGAAITVVLSPAVGRGLLPLAIVLRSVPLVAMTPLIVLVFGRGPAAVAVIGGLIVFFPTLVTVAVGLRSTPRSAADLIRVHGGGRLAVLRWVGLPGALPFLFASMRLSAPAALVGALLAEWLATGDGIGYRMQRDITAFHAADLWSALVLVTLCSLGLHAIVAATEAVVIGRCRPQRRS